jgi:uncharacterized membrane protein
MNRFKKMLRGRTANERGATFVLTALSMVLLLWAGATGVDVGFTVYGSRQAQAMADTAAIDLARYISYADTLPSITAVNTYFSTKLAQVLADNNGSNAQLTVIAGYFANGTFKPNGYNGTSCKPVLLPFPGVPGCNAIEVTANQGVPQIFFGGTNLLSGHAGNGANGPISGSVSGSSIALYSPEASFSIGSYLASFNSQQSAVLNKIMGPLGTNVSFTALGFQGLATTQVTLAQLINANSTVLSASNIMTTSLSAGGWLTAYKNAVASVYGTGGTAYASLQAQSFSTSASTNVRLCDLVWVNTPGTQFNCTNTSISPQGLRASLNVLQMLTTEADFTDGQNAIDVTSALNLSSPLGNFGTTTLSLHLIQPLQVAYGPIGTTASTAQVTATLNVSLASLLGISIGTLSIPLSAASGTVALQALSCTNNAMTSTQLLATTNAVSAAVTLSGAQVAALNISGVSPAQSATFTASQVPPPATNNPASVGTTSPTFSFSGQSGLGLTNLFVNGLLSSTSVLAAAYGPVLQALGVQVAGAQLTDYYTNCDAVQLAS